MEKLMRNLDCSSYVEVQLEISFFRIFKKTNKQTNTYHENSPSFAPWKLGPGF